MHPKGEYTELKIATDGDLQVSFVLLAELKIPAANLKWQHPATCKVLRK